MVERLSARGLRRAQAWAALAVAVVAFVMIINGWGMSRLARELGLLTDGNLEWPT